MEHVGEGTKVRAQPFRIGEGCRIGKNVSIFCPGGFRLGDFCSIGDNTRIECWGFTAGDRLFMKDHVLVGGGGAFSSPRSIAVLGDHVFVGERSILNTNLEIFIGDRVGIGADVGIWTHGAYPNYLRGAPAKFDSVTIESDTWVQGASHILPGTCVGFESIVLMGSIVVHHVIPRTTVGGAPAKELGSSHTEFDGFPHSRLVKIAEAYKESTDWRGLDVTVETRYDEIWLVLPGGDTACFYKLDTHSPSVLLSTDRALSEDEEALIDDAADFLRRWGIRVETGRPYRSIQHPSVRTLKEKRCLQF